MPKLAIVFEFRDTEQSDQGERRHGTFYLYRIISWHLRILTRNAELIFTVLSIFHAIATTNRGWQTNESRQSHVLALVGSLKFGNEEYVISYSSFKSSSGHMSLPSEAFDVVLELWC